MIRTLFTMKHPPVDKSYRDYNESDWMRLKEKDAKAKDKNTASAAESPIKNDSEKEPLVVFKR